MWKLGIWESVIGHNMQCAMTSRIFAAGVVSPCLVGFQILEFLYLFLPQMLSDEAESVCAIV